MYCPKCGRQAAADNNSRFCADCGQNLAKVAPLLEGDAAEALATAAPSAPARAEHLSPRQKGLRVGLVLVVVALALVPLAYLLRDHFLDKMIYLLVPAALLGLAGVGRAAYALLLEDGEAPEPSGALTSAAGRLAPERAVGAGSPASLPPPRVSMGDIIAEEREAEAALNARGA